MAFYGYKGDVDNCYCTPYSSSNFDSTPIQYSSSYEPQFIDYNSSTYYINEPTATPSELNLSVRTYTEPEILHYNPIEYHSSHYYYESFVNPLQLLQSEPSSYNLSTPTEFKISYSVSEFNEPEFEEYDPTPYGGGYDPVATYGRPLPPSDKICYPRSVPKSDTTPNFSYNSIPPKSGEEDDLPSKPSNAFKPPIDTKPDPKIENGGKISNDGVGEITEPLAVIPIDKCPSFEHESGFENGIKGNYGYESDRQMAQIPYGSGLEAMDICETIFGHWPCLAKIEQRQRDKLREIYEQERRDDPWNTAADYLFGSPIVYNYESYR